MKKIFFLPVLGFLVGCNVPTNEESNQHYIQARSAICRDFKACDTLESSIRYELSFDDGTSKEVSQEVYNKCGSNEFYPQCLKED